MCSRVVKSSPKGRAVATEEKGVGEWILFGVFQASILVYGFMGIRHQLERMPMDAMGDQAILLWVMMGVAGALFLAGYFGGGLFPSALARGILRWAVYNCIAVLGLVLAFLGFPTFTWVGFPIVATALMIMHRPAGAD